MVEVRNFSMLTPRPRRAPHARIGSSGFPVKELCEFQLQVLLSLLLFL